MKKIGDSAIALTVVACSAALFAALAFALQGNPFDRPSRTLRAQFSDVTGIQQSSLVKYAGATAGSVHRVRMLTPEERLASTNPANTIEITVALNNNVPVLSEGVTASVSADTLLSDKFILLSGGSPKAPVLANNALIQSVAPVTFDALLRDLSSALASLRGLLGTARADSLDGLLPKVNQLLADLSQAVGQAQTLITSGNGLITNANGLVDNGDALIAKTGQLIDANIEPLNRTIRQFSSAADSLDSLARRADKLIKDNEGNINSASADARAALSELKEVATSTHAFVNGLRARPQQLIWGPGRRANQTGN